MEFVKIVAFLTFCGLLVIKVAFSLPMEDNEYRDIDDVPCTDGYVMDGQGNCVPISDPITPDPVDYCDLFPDYC